MDPFPTVNKAYSMVLRVERQRLVNLQTTKSSEGVALHSKWNDNRGNFGQRKDVQQQIQYADKGNFKGRGSVDKRTRTCSNCGKIGHTKDTCFKLYGVPEWYKNLKDQKRREGGTTKGFNVTSAERNSEGESAVDFGEAMKQGDDFAGIGALHISFVTDFGSWIVDTVHGHTTPVFLSSYPLNKTVLLKGNTNTLSTQPELFFTKPLFLDSSGLNVCLLQHISLIVFLPQTYTGSHLMKSFTIKNHPLITLESGCLYYATNVNPNKDNFDPRAFNCIFIGYSQNHKGYKLYHQDNKIIFTSRDVLFNEDVFPLANVSAIPTSYLPTAIPDPTPSHAPPMNSHTPTLSPTTTANPLIEPSISAPTPPSPALRRSHRHITQPHWLQDYIYNHSTLSPHHCDLHSFSSAHLSFLAQVEVVHKPKSFSKANQHVHWQEAMAKELEALEKNDGSIDRYKARLVAKGYTLVEGVDYFDSFSPVAKTVTVCLFIAIATSHQYPLLQLDVNNAFLHRQLDEEVYLQPLGYTKATRGLIFLLPSSSSVSSSSFLVNLIGKLPFTCLLENKEIGNCVRSSAKAEYRSMGSMVCELLWISYLLCDFGVPILSQIPFYCDNKAAIHITENLVFHERIKHLDIDCHLVREHFKRGFILPSHISSPQQLVDLFTKALPVVPFARLLFKLGLLSYAPT
ncbi:UNVERIFIED_CONTAM: Retrovirus-related Pol polyprotein from transposon RE2 [Sesamum calycinum]|uniref:Retrovirus-related Pol polyprotein from transposon RE2 n=1 Tax=Sesamum calycinum TaxID=2727403 RepID=A0AAW2RSI8_9LAMI